MTLVETNHPLQTLYEDYLTFVGKVDLSFAFVSVLILIKKNLNIKHISRLSFPVVPSHVVLTD